MTREQFERTAFRCSYEEHSACECHSCNRNCIHRDVYRRLPVIDGGLGLCERLKEIKKQ